MLSKHSWERASWRQVPANLLLCFNMADEARSPAKKRRKTEKRILDRDKKIEEQEQSAKATRKIIYYSNAYIICFEIKYYGNEMLVV